jgi:branched-chain amino acid transport system substrate-binding protein
VLHSSGTRRGIGSVASLTVGFVLLGTGCGTRVSAPPAAPPTGVAPASSTPSAVTSNPASDIGVTPTTVTVGLLVSRTSPLGPDVFSGSYYGAMAYWNTINEQGGIDGRKIKVAFCDDTGSGSGNVSCVHKLIDNEQIFALAGTTAFSYDGDTYVNQKGVPDVGGQPVGNGYDQYAHLWNLYGSDEPRTGTVGWDGKLYAGTEVYQYFKQKLDTKNAAVVFYNVAQSQRFALSIEAGLRKEGYTVREEQVNLGLANFDSIAVDSAGAKVDSVYDALDDTGNERLCQALDAHHVKLKAKVTTTQGWTSTIASEYKSSPTCRNTIYATGDTQNYDDRSKPGVAAFQDAVNRFFPTHQDTTSEWELEGWASAQWLADAMRSCGAKLTRACVESYLRSQKAYTGHGLLTARNFVVQRPPPTKNSCINVARWQDSADGGKGGWVSQVADMNKNCFDAAQLPYSP